MLDVDYKSDGSELGDILLQALSENPQMAARAATKSVEYMKKLIASRLKRTGFMLMKPMKQAIRENKYAMQPHARYGPTGAVMATTIRSYLSSAKSIKPMRMDGGVKPRAQKPGARFAMLFQYISKPTSGDPDLKVGAVPQSEGGRAGAYWAEAFSKWQEAGTLDSFPYTGSSGQMRGVQGFLGAIGLPVRKGIVFRRPARPFIETAQQQEDPTEVFRKLLTEKLERL
jgi:hypothetical protein